MPVRDGASTLMASRPPRRNVRSPFDETLSTLLDAAIAKVTVQQNTDMRRISAWVAIAAVPTMIAGIYGMNFDRMPELHWEYGYYLVVGVIVVGLGGGLIKPMQHRWERMLNRAETETTIAAERMRANRAAREAARPWDTTAEREAGDYIQPAYGGMMATDEKPPATMAGAAQDEEYAQYPERTDDDR